MKIPEKPPCIKEILKDSTIDLIKFTNPTTKEFIKQCNEKYISWNDLKYKSLPEDIKPLHMWMYIKLFRLSQYRIFNFKKWNFNFLLTNDSQRIIHLIDKVNRGVGDLKNLDKERYVVSSLMEEAIASSQLEGAATTRKVAKDLLRKRKKPKNYSEQMIVNGFKTIQKITKLIGKKLTPELIIELQKEITQNTLKDETDSGKFRDRDDVVIGDISDIEKIYYHPPKHKEISMLIKEFCDFANTEDSSIHPVIKAIFLHFLIGYIHPFNDGNGRTARTIFYWYLLSQGYWIFEFISVSRIILKSKKKYGLAYLYTETDENDLTYFINYNLESIEEALIDMEKHIAIKQKEQTDALHLIKNIQNINLRQAEILKEFLKEHNKNFVVAEIMTSFDVAYDTARNDLLHLVKEGFLEKIKDQKKFIFKLVKEKIKLIS